MQKNLFRSVNVKDELSYNMVLNYYITENDSGMFGVAIEKQSITDTAVFCEAKETECIFPTFDKAAEILNILSHGKVTPMYLTEVIREVLF